MKLVSMIITSCDTIYDPQMLRHAFSVMLMKLLRLRRHSHFLFQHFTNRCVAIMYIFCMSSHVNWPPVRFSPTWILMMKVVVVVVECKITCKTRSKIGRWHP